MAYLARNSRSSRRDTKVLPGAVQTFTDFKSPKDCIDYINKNTRISKVFDDGHRYFGTIKKYDKTNGWWLVVYDDEDKEEYTTTQILNLLEDQAKRTETPSIEGKDPVDSVEDEHGGASQYELKRQANIKRNQEIFQNLGISSRTYQGHLRSISCKFCWRFC